MVAAGGYGRSGMARVIAALMKVKHPITVIAICGTNTRLFKRLQKLKAEVTPRIDLRPYEFVPHVYELNRAADVLLTKGGPNAMLDSVLMGVPVGVFYCASPIEYQSMHLFTSILNCGRFFKTSFKIVRWINECVTNPAILDIYKEAAQEVRRKGNGAEYIAKFIQSYNE
jgi:UDP-N-acetylglucosamine:LPS N-acetylglucosamine transferase